MFIAIIIGLYFCSAPVGVAVGVYGDSSLHVISLTKTGAVYSWGYNSNGCLGLQNNTNSPILAPSPIQKGLDNVRITQVSCGRLFNLALSNNGEVMVMQCMFINLYVL